MKRHGFLQNTIVLFAAMALTKVIGAFFKIPLANLLGGMGMSYYISAFNLFTPVFAVTAAAIPTVMTRMTARAAACGGFREVRLLKRCAVLMGVAAGLIGTLAVTAISVPFTEYAAHCPQSLAAVLVIAPSVLLCCISSVYRGYYEGICNMFPTAISQVVEAAVKAAVGLTAAYLVLCGGFFGSAQAALPYAAAGAALGVTVSELASLLFLVLRARLCGDGITTVDLAKSPPPRRMRLICGDFLRQCVPVALGALAATLVSFIDLVTITGLIDASVETNTRYFLETYINGGLTVSSPSELGTFMYGSYSGIVMSVFMLAACMTGMIGKSSLPNITDAWARKDERCLRRSIKLLLKGTMAVGTPFCLGLAALSEPALQILYPNKAGEIAVSVIPLFVLSLGGIWLSFSGSIFSVFQAIGRDDLLIKLMSVGAAVKLVLNLLLLPFKELNVAGAALATVTAYFVICIIGVVILRRLVRGSVDIPDIIVKPLVCGLLCGAAALAGYYWLFSAFPLLIRAGTAVLFAGTIWFAAAGICDKALFETAEGLKKRKKC